MRVPSTALELQAGSKSSTQEELLAQPHEWVLGVSVQHQRWDIRGKGLKLVQCGHVNSLHLFPVFLCPEKSKNSKTRCYSKGSPLAGVSGFLPLWSLGCLQALLLFAGFSLSCIPCFPPYCTIVLQKLSKQWNCNLLLSSYTLRKTWPSLPCTAETVSAHSLHLCIITCTEQQLLMSRNQFASRLLSQTLSDYGCQSPISFAC